MSQEKITVDARGKSCPEPVVLTRKALESRSGGEIEVFLDSPVAKENVSRLAKGKGCSVTVEEHGGEYHLRIKK